MSGRLEYLLHWLCKCCPDVVPLQKIRGPEERIPTMALNWARNLIGAYRQDSMDSDIGKWAIGTRPSVESG